MSSSSPFLAADPREWIASNELAFALPDRFPVSPGHTLVVPKRVVITWFDATPDEQLAIIDLIRQVKHKLDDELRPRPDGYNVGFNAGEAAGQTVMHLHVHIIPRSFGDVDDPRGGVRGVIPSKQKYDGLRPRTPSSSSTPFAHLIKFVHGDEVHFAHSLQEAIRCAEHIDLLSAFVQTSGLKHLLDDLRDALKGGAHVRLLTGDYLGITSPDALRQLLSLADDHESFQPFFFEVANGRAFHPKAYVFRKGPHGLAYVGSSNMSDSALTHGVEWNLRLVSSDDAESFCSILQRFESLLASPQTKPLTRALIDAYELRVPERPAPAPEPRAPIPMPTSIQREALDALKTARRDGKTRGLVVLATGLGKTYLSAFDFKAMRGERALFIAHREEILDQAKDTWQSVFPDKVIGTYQGTKRERDVDIVFASVQTLARASHLSRFTAQHFDYIVIDEFHHAAAATYRKILAHFAPRFLLGLTATPERTDGKSLLELCGENLIYRRNLVHGISQGLLVPFRYFAVKDSVDFEPIPWRNGRFDPTELTAAVATEEHAEQALSEYERRAISDIGTSDSSVSTRRTLCFCCNVVHADFMADFLRRKGKRAVAVHSGPTSAPRAGSLRALKSGELEILCAVDVFNEGLDVPDINTVLMLRPTESPVIFLQQLGRGLRKAAGKDALVVVDFIGNHRSFLSKPQSLMFLLGHDLPPRVAIEKIREKTLEMPEGCSIEIETEALDLLASMVRASQEEVAVYEYASFRDTHGRRPSAAELFAEGVGFKAIRDNYASWFHFVDAQNDLTDDESRVLKRHDAWLKDLLRTKMSKAYRMIALRALIEADMLFVGMDVEENARRSFQALRDDFMFFRELSEDADRRAWGTPFVRKWRDEPLGIWVQGGSTSSAWFRLDGDSFVPTFEVDAEDRDVFEEMTEEMLDLRLVEHRDRLLRKQSLDATQAPIVLTVSHSNRRPILRFDRERRADIPEGLTPVEVRGEELSLDFRKIAVNVATRDGSPANVLPKVLHDMFGPTAGLPGIRHRARLVRDADGWRLERDEAASAVVESSNVLPFQRVPYYADVKVACGGFEETAQQDESVEQIQIQTSLTVDPRKHFVVQASGDSMNGGDAPIRDGDRVLCEWDRDASRESIEGRPYLLVGHDMAESSFAVIKVPRKTPAGWRLESWNPDFPPQPIPKTTKLQPVAKVLRVIEEPLGLVLYGAYDRDALAELFGSENNPSWRSPCSERAMRSMTRPGARRSD